MRDPNQTHKPCSMCKKVKPVSEFPESHKDVYNLHATVCLKCMRVYGLNRMIIRDRRNRETRRDVQRRLKEEGL